MDCLTTYCFTVDDELKWKWLIDYKNSQIKIKDNGLSATLTNKPETETSLSPYVKVNFNHLSYLIK